MSGAARHTLDSAAKLLTVTELVAVLEAQENWRPIPDWSYEVSSWGNVRRVGKGAPLKLIWVKGYACVDLSSEGFVRRRRVQQLVARAFIGPPPFEGAIVAHQDGERTNNRLSNLYWASTVQNQADSSRHGTRPHGSEVFGAKLKEADIPAIRARIKARDTYDDIAADYDVCKSTIYLIAKNKNWRGVGGAAWRVS